MKRFFTLMLVVFGLVSISLYGQHIPDQDNSRNPLKHTKGSKGWTVQFVHSVTNASSAGCETDGTYFYVAQWNSNTIWKFDMTGTQIATFTIPGVTGLRDLAYDGTYFYGGANANVIYKMNFNATPPSLVSTINIVPGGKEVRNICYQADSNALWVGGWATDLSLVNMSGNVIRTIPAATHGLASTYGTAYDDVSVGGPYIWAIDAGASGTPATITQINATTGLQTGTTHSTSDVGTTIGGGLWIHPNIVPGTVTLGGMIQGESIFGYDLASTVPLNNDMQMNSLDSPKFFEAINIAVPISGEVQNAGINNVTSFDISYAIDGGTPITESITGVNLSFNDTYTYTLTNTWTPTVTGFYEFVIWTSNVNGQPDDYPGNDTVYKTVQVVNAVAPKTVIIEEFTGAWCGYCPDGAVVVEEIINIHGSDVIAVAIHDGDAMEFSDGIRTAFNATSYPSAMIDRVKFPGEAKEAHSRANDAWKNNVNSQLNAFSPCSVGVTFTYDNITREINATVTANYIEAATGDMRFIFMVVEDEVTGTGTGYNQTNYYNTTAGHPYYQAGNPIIGFVHKHVLRAVPSGAQGNAGVIPNNVTSNSNYSENFTYTLPAAYNEAKVSLVGMVAYYSTTIGQRYVLNAKEVHLLNVGINEDDANDHLVSLFPNPANNSVNVSYKLEENNHVSFSIFNMIGNEVFSSDVFYRAAGIHNEQIDVNNLSGGVYSIQLKTGNKTFTQKLIISK